MKLTPLVAAAAALVVLAACTTDQTATSESGTSAPAEPPIAAERWETAIANTATMGGVSLEAQIVTDVEGFERVEIGEGYVHIPSASGDMLWTDDRSVLREVRVPPGHYIELDDVWYAESQDIPTTIAFTPLAGLDSASEVTEAGDDNVLGIPTKRYEAVLLPDAGLMGFSTEELTVMDPASGSLTATIWIDAEDRIVRVVREYATDSLDGDSIKSTVLFLLNDFGNDQPIDVPETADAIPAPA